MCSDSTPVFRFNNRAPVLVFQYPGGFGVPHAVAHRGFDVCHFDGNKTNNALSNLRIDNRKGNMRDQIRMEKTPRGEKSGSNKYSESLIKIVKEKLLAGENISSLHLATGIPKTSLYSIKRGDNWGWL